MGSDGNRGRVQYLYLHYTPGREFVNTVSLRFPEKKTETPGEQNGTVRTCRLNQFLTHAEMRRRGVFIVESLSNPPPLRVRSE